MKKVFLLVLAITAVQNYAFSQAFDPTAWRNTVYVGPTYSNWASYPSYIKMSAKNNIGADVGYIHRFGLHHDTSGMDNIAINLGLGLSMVNIHANIDPFGSNSTGFDTVGKVGIVGNDYRKNKLALSYLEIPVELVFKVHPSSGAGFKIAIGFRGGVCIDAHSKYVRDDFTYKLKSFNNIEMWRYGPTVRIGLGSFSLFGRYDMNSTFDASKAPKYSLYTIGLMVSSY
jgi:hypothetical protein